MDTYIQGDIIIVFAINGQLLTPCCESVDFNTLAGQFIEPRSHPHAHTQNPSTPSISTALYWQAALSSQSVNWIYTRKADKSGLKQIEWKKSSVVSFGIMLIVWIFA